MPQRPDEPRDDGCCGKTIPLGQLRHQKSSPANLFSKHGRKIFNYANGRRENEVERDANPRRNRAQTEALQNGFNEPLVVEAANSCQPDQRVNQRRIEQRNQVASHLVARVSPLQSGSPPKRIQRTPCCRSRQFLSARPARKSTPNRTTESGSKPLGSECFPTSSQDCSRGDRDACM